MKGHGCHSPVTIVTKKYLLSPSSGPGPGLGVDKDSRDALHHLGCQRAQGLLEMPGKVPSERTTWTGSRAPQPSLERQVMVVPFQLRNLSETQRRDIICLRCHMAAVTLFILSPCLLLSTNPLFIHPSFHQLGVQPISRSGKCV